MGPERRAQRADARRRRRRGHGRRMAARRARAARGRASFALVTGCQMAHVTALAAARQRVLADVGWEVGTQGLVGRAAGARARGRGAPHHARPRAAAARARHRVPRAGRRRRRRGDAGRRAGGGARGGRRAGDRLRAGGQRQHRRGRPARRRSPISAAAAGAWVHVDGAFGLWAAASPRRRALVAGVERADSWATDAHKWLNVPYDCGIAFVADPEAHRAAMRVTASYLPAADEGGLRDADRLDAGVLAPRARLRGLRGAALARPRRGRRARRPAVRLRGAVRRAARRRARRRGARAGPQPGARALRRRRRARPTRRSPPSSATARAAWAGRRGGGRRCMRLSVCNWRTTAADVDRSVAAIRRVLG